MVIYSAAECQHRNMTGYLMCGELQSQHKERCKQEHVCISDNTTNNNIMDVQILGFWSVDWAPYSQDRIQDRAYVNDVMNGINIIVQSNTSFY